MKLLIVLSRFPYPLDKGDKLRAFFQIRELSRRHEITLCAVSHEEVSDHARAALAPFCKRIEVLRLNPRGAALGVARAARSGDPFQVGYFYSPRAHRRIEHIFREVRPDRALFQLVRAASYAQGLDVASTLDYMDAFSWSTRKIAEHQGGMVGHLRAREADRLLRYEAEVLTRFARCSIITAQDRARLKTPRRDEISVVPNGVDLDAFSPRREGAQCDLLFVGHMSYPPNIAAAQTLALEILPRVKRHVPGATLRLAGTCPAPSVSALRSGDVDVTGWVDDMPGCYASARVFVAPISLGSGMPNKVLQALAMSVPCVTTPEVGAALEAGREVLALGASPDELAHAITELLRNARAARDLGSAGRAFVESKFRWDRAVETLESVLS